MPAASNILITMAIAMHNIPEGMVIASPLYASTGNKCKAFLWTFYSGMAETFGAVIKNNIKIKKILKEINNFFIKFIDIKKI